MFRFRRKSISLWNLSLVSHRSILRFCPQQASDLSYCWLRAILNGGA
ncbi:unnamed protein product [Rhodiola kirilowii]